MDDYITPSLGGRIRANRPPVRALSRAIRPNFAHLRSSSNPRSHTNRTYRTVHITMTLANAIDADAAAAVAVLAESSQALAAEHGESLRAAARAAAVTADAVFSSPPAARSPARHVGGARRRRTPMSSDTKLRVFGWHAAGKSIDVMSRQLNQQYDRSGLHKIIKQKDALLARAAEGAAGRGLTFKTSNYPDVDKKHLECFLAVRARGQKRVPWSLTILRAKAVQIAEHLGVTDFAASNSSSSGRRGVAAFRTSRYMVLARPPM